jgi:anti-sigma regulatory factor (Ser/Thr protein kinase)
MRLAQDYTAAWQARRYVRRWSNNHHLPQTAVADIELVVDELVNNAVTHGSPPYDLEIFHVNGKVRGEVHDGSTTTPTTNTHPDYRGGFGLHIVTSRTSRWGTAITPDGKQVWFEIDP